MTWEDYDQVPGWPQEPLPVHRVRTHRQLGADKTNAKRWRTRAEQQPPHPKCSYCRCEHCREAA